MLILYYCSVCFQVGADFLCHFDCLVFSKIVFIDGIFFLISYFHDDSIFPVWLFEPYRALALFTLYKESFIAHIIPTLKYLPQGFPLQRYVYSFRRYSTQGDIRLYSSPSLLLRKPG